MMTPDLIQRYQPGGDIYNQIVAAYGVAAANAVASAATTGDRTQVTDAIASVKYGQPKQDSTAVIFVDQLLTDPLAAPIASADSLIRKTLLAIGANPFFLIAGIVVVGAAVLVLRAKPGGK